MENVANENTVEKNEVMVVEETNEKPTAITKIKNGIKAHPIISGAIIVTVTTGIGYLIYRAVTKSDIPVECGECGTYDDGMKVVNENGEVLGDVYDITETEVVMKNPIDATPDASIDISSEVV